MFGKMAVAMQSHVRNFGESCWKSFYSSTIGTICNTQFCWHCSRTYLHNGSIQHKEDCEQARSGQPDIHDRTVTLEELFTACSLLSRSLFPLSILLTILLRPRNRSRDTRE